jgi:hypothetical protein
MYKGWWEEEEATTDRGGSNEIRVSQFAQSALIWPGTQQRPYHVNDVTVASGPDLMLEISLLLF